SESDANRDATQALARAGARQVALTSPDGVTRVPAIIERDGDAFLIGINLPALPNGQTYQLWGQTNDGLISLGVLGPHPPPEAFQVGGGVTGLAITAERAPGVKQSTNSPRVATTLT